MISRKDSKAKLPQSSPSSDEPVTHGCVLLVEDDASVKRYLELFLERAKYKVVSARDGQDAITLLETLQVDVVITDAAMPKMDGYALSRFIKSTKQFSHLPIILLSGLEPENGEEGLADAFLPKPVPHDELLECLSRMVRKQA